MAGEALMVSSQDVYDLLRDVGYNADLRPARWVMNLEWYKAIRREFLRPDDDARNEAEWEPSDIDTVLGYYITVTEDGGRPHLAEQQVRR
jgi:hypothetical protein